MSITELNQILKRPQVEQVTGLSRASIYRMMQDGTFPKNISLGGSRSVGWKASDIQQWIDEQVSPDSAA